MPNWILTPALYCSHLSPRKKHRDDATFAMNYMYIGGHIVNLRVSESSIGYVVFVFLILGGGRFM
jgi:hypothetical protein